MNSRIRYSETGGHIKIVIAPKRTLGSWAHVLLSPVWIAAFCLGVRYTVSGINIHTHTIDFAGPFLILIFYPAVLYSLWLLSGKEVIHADASCLIIQHKFLGISLRRMFDAARISDIRSSEPTPYKHYGGRLVHPFSYTAAAIWYPGTIVLVYENKQYRFASHLTDEEARQLINRLSQYLPKSAFGEEGPE